MKLKSILHLLPIFFLISLKLKAQEAIDYKIYDHKLFAHQTLNVFSENGVITLFAIRPNVIKLSFSSIKNNEKQTDQKDNGVYVRITQNLESIFMQTDSLLIVVSKLDFSIKFQNLKEGIFTENLDVYFTREDLNLKFSVNNDELFFNQKHRILRQKKYRINKLKSVYSSKQYSIYFDKEADGSLDFSEKAVFKMKLFSADGLGFYFKTI